MYAIVNFGGISPIGTFSSASQTGAFVSTLLSLITLLAGLYFLWQLALSGLSMATSSGDEKELTKAKRAMGSALLGFVLVVASYFVVGYIATRLGFSSIFTPNIATVPNPNFGCVSSSFTNNHPGSVNWLHRLTVSSIGIGYSVSTQKTLSAGATISLKNLRISKLGPTGSQVEVLVQKMDPVTKAWMPGSPVINFLINSLPEYGVGCKDLNP